MRGTTRHKVFGALMAGLSCTFGVVILAATPAMAAPFTDGSFEVPDIGTNFQTFTTGQMIGPWQVTGTSVDLVDGVLNGTPGSDGVQWIDLAGSPGPGGVQQLFDTVNGQQVTVAYDVANRCGVSTTGRAFVNGVQVDTVTFPGNSPFVTRTFTFTATGPSTALAFDTTATSNCGISLDNVRVLAAAGASPASQCATTPGHRVQFRKFTAALTNEAVSDQAMVIPPTDPSVLARATDNGVPTIHYSDAGYSVPGQAALGTMRDVGTPPLTAVAGAFLVGPGGIDPNFVMRSSGYINVPTAGVWNFTVHGDDQFRLAIGSPPQLVSSFPTNATDSTTTAPVFFSAPGCYYYTLQHANGPSSSSVSLSATGPGQATATLVGLGALLVYQGVDNPTSCKITGSGGPPAFQEVTITDADTIGSILATGTNATFSLVGPPLPPGVGTTQIVRATKVTPGTPTVWKIDFYDWNGNYKLCQ